MVYSFIIRRAVPDDAQDVFSIIQSSFKDYARKAGIKTVDALKETVEHIRKEIAEKTVYIALIDNNIVGTVRVDIEEQQAYVSRFAVSSEHRNIGIGKSLMNLVDKYLTSEGIKKVRLHTASKYTDLMRFYYGRGFFVEEVTNERGYLRANLVKEYDY